MHHLECIRKLPGTGLVRHHGPSLPPPPLYKVILHLRRNLTFVVQVCHAVSLVGDL